MGNVTILQNLSTRADSPNKFQIQENADGTISYGIADAYGTFTHTDADTLPLTLANALTITNTAGSTLAVGTGGTLGTAAYTAATAYEASGAVATHAALTTGVHGLAITAGQTLTVTTGGTLATGAYAAMPTVVGDYLNDVAAAAGGIPVGGLYHTSGVVHIRLA